VAVESCAEAERASGDAEDCDVAPAAAGCVVALDAEATFTLATGTAGSIGIDARAG
jgi:hypothetical protein